MVREANVRMFIPEGDLRWRNLAIEYIRAMVKAGLEPLLLVIPFAVLDAHNPLYEFWKYFCGRLSSSYVNVVFGVQPISATNVLTGLKQMQAATDKKRGLPTNTDDLEEPNAVTDFARLWTAGVPNIAMIGDWPRPLVSEEWAALDKYDLICRPFLLDSMDYETSPEVFAAAVDGFLP
jgi:hypothetical protein